jgi:hypothetical protein
MQSIRKLGVNMTQEQSLGGDSRNEQIKLTSLKVLRTKGV